MSPGKLMEECGGEWTGVGIGKVDKVARGNRVTVTYPDRTGFY